MKMQNEKNLLVVIQYLTRDPAKTFALLILKYLCNLGWDVTVVTLDTGQSTRDAVTTWEGITIISVVPNRGWKSRFVHWVDRQRSQIIHSRRRLLAQPEKRGLSTWFLAVLSLLFLSLTPLTALSGVSSVYSRDMWHAMIRLHSQRPFCAVLSVFGQFPAHQLARRLKSEVAVPWLALLKDYYNKPLSYAGYEAIPLVERLKLAVKMWYERRTLSRSSTIIALCEPLAEHVGSFVRGVPIRVIPNCYDEDDYAVDLGNGSIAHKPSKNRPFVISWVGRVFDYDLNMLFDALHELSREQEFPWGSLKVRFVGAEEEILRSYSQAHDCENILEIVPVMPHREAVLQMREATCLLFMQIRGALPRRTPEYIAARRPILAFPQCSLAGSEPVLREYEGAVIAADKEEIKSTLLSWYHEFRSTGKVYMPINEDLVQSFSARNRAKELNQALEETMSNFSRHST